MLWVEGLLYDSTIWQTSKDIEFRASQLLSAAVAATMELLNPGGLQVSEVEEAFRSRDRRRHHAFPSNRFF
jgi:hypothetical protein